MCINNRKLLLKSGFSHIIKLFEGYCLISKFSADYCVKDIAVVLKDKVGCRDVPLQLFCYTRQAKCCFGLAQGVAFGDRIITEKKRSGFEVLYVVYNWEILV